jgi:hypothetical protein
MGQMPRYTVGDVSYGGFLALRNPKESEDEPAAITLGGLEAFPETLSTILTARDANGMLSRLLLASSPGAFTAPQIARRLRSPRLSPSSAIHSASPAAPSLRSKSRCWLRASATDNAGTVKAAKLRFGVTKKQKSFVTQITSLVP